MGQISTPFLSSQEISVNNTDLYDDAWGFYSEFHDVIDILKMVKIVPGRQLTRRLIRRISESNL